MMVTILAACERDLLSFESKSGRESREKGDEPVLHRLVSEYLHTLHSSSSELE